PKDMIAVPLARPLTFTCVASPAYFDRLGKPETPEELQRHRCIGHRMPSGKLYRWEFERAGQELAIDADGPIVLDDEELMVEAARQEKPN
ncbi:LysR family transcriptional regulator, partial [Mesorhizobium sp. M6A.T.Ce.TU.002.03.1.1]